jgi:hypothetical protein
MGWGRFLEGLQKIWSNNTFSVLYGQYQWWVGRFVPVVMVVERGDATGAWYWRSLPTKTLVFERRSVLQGINILKNTLWSCVVAVLSDITN